MRIMDIVNFSTVQKPEFFLKAKMNRIFYCCKDKKKTFYLLYFLGDLSARGIMRGQQILVDFFHNFAFQGTT